MDWSVSGSRSDSRSGPAHVPASLPECTLGREWGAFKWQVAEAGSLGRPSVSSVPFPLEVDGGVGGWRGHVQAGGRGEGWVGGALKRGVCRHAEARTLPSPARCLMQPTSPF